MAKLGPQDYTMLVTCAEKKKTHSHTPAPTWPVPSHFRFLSAWEPLSVYNPALFKRNSLGGIRSRCPYAEFLSSVRTPGWESEQHGKQRHGLFRHRLAPPWHPGNVPMAILSYFWYLFRTSQAVCGGRGWNRERLCSGNLNVKKKKKSQGSFFHKRGEWVCANNVWSVPFLQCGMGRVPMGLSHSVSQDKSGKRASPYRHGESVVIAFLLWPCWLADSLTWDHSGQLTSISLCCALPARYTTTKASPPHLTADSDHTTAHTPIQPRHTRKILPSSSERLYTRTTGNNGYLLNDILVHRLLDYCILHTSFQKLYAAFSEKTFVTAVEIPIW